MVEPIRAPFAAFIGAIAEEMSEGYVRLSLQTGPQHADVNGWVHTGVLTAVMDSVIGIALGTLRGERGTYRPHATIDMSTSFFSQATPGDEIVAEGRVIKVAERVAFGEVEARRRGDGELIAKARLTFAIPAGQP
jgi:acyl-coenzyme A thioesterase 13